MITKKVGAQTAPQAWGNPNSGGDTDFIIDTRAELSVLKEPLGKLKNKKSVVIVATCQNPYSWTTDNKVDLRRSQVTHYFLIIPECSTPLLGRDLLSK